MGLRTLVGERVSLRAVRDDDLAGIDARYGEAGDGRSVGAQSGDLLVIERIGEPAAIGIVEYATRDGWLTVEFIALAKGCRGWGYGSEAVRLLEAWAVREGMAERFRAEVPVGNGLGLYFWLRLGYRPAGRDEFEWRAHSEGDRMAMVRVG